MTIRLRTRGYTTIYQPLVDYLSAYEGDAVTLPLAAIEALIGRPLSTSAYVSGGYWFSRRQSPAIHLAKIGWRAQLRFREHTVTFRRIDPEG